MKVAIRKISNMVYLDFFNSKEVYAIKGFETERKARNYAKKCGKELHENLPNGIKEYENWN